MLYKFFNKLHGIKLIKPSDLNSSEKKSILVVCKLFSLLAYGIKSDIIVIKINFKKP